MKTIVLRRALALPFITALCTTLSLAQSPEGLRAVKVDGETATLAWHPVKGAASYRVLCEGKSCLTVKDTTAVVKELHPFDVYYFTVQALNSAKKFIGESQPLYIATPEAREQRDARMSWWRESRFGMFIHWGPYSALAGHYSGPTLLQPQQGAPWILRGGVMKNYYSCMRPEWVTPDGSVRTNPATGKPHERGGYAEWIMFDAQIPRAEYLRRTRTGFRAENYNPKEWVRMAKEAGMRYIIITSKHHDGIALFDTKGDGHSIASDTEIRRDILKELVDEARKAGLKIGFYYSQALDWNDLGGMDYVPQNETPDHRAPYELQVQYNQKVIRHVQHIIRNYGVDVLWWDMGFHSKPEFRYQLMKAIKQMPGTQKLIFNDRIDDHLTGDFKTPEQSIPDVPSTGDGTDWETCMTLNDNWGYAAHDYRWKSSPDLIRKLVDITSKGGNFLLNIGPKANGTFPQESIDRLADMGRWMKVNGEAIHGTQASPFSPQVEWGRATRKVVNGKERLYLHVFTTEWPKHDRLALPPLKGTIQTAYLLADANKQPLMVESINGQTVILLPSSPIDTVSTTVVLEMK